VAIQRGKKRKKGAICYVGREKNITRHYKEVLSFWVKVNLGRGRATGNKKKVKGRSRGRDRAVPERREQDYFRCGKRGEKRGKERRKYWK